MHRLLIALAALILFGAQLTAPAEAQGWTCTYDFSTGDQGWVTSTYAKSGAELASGTHSGGVWTTTDYANSPYYFRALNIALSFSSTTITSASVNYSYSAGTFDPSTPGYWVTLRMVIAGTQTAYQTNGYSMPSSPITWSGSVTGTQAGIFLASSGRTSSGYSGSASISSITLGGTGTTPCPATPTPAPPTSTPAPTPTDVDPVMFAQSNWSCPFDLRSQLQGWQVITGSYQPGAGIQGTNEISVTLPLQAGTSLYDIRFDYDATQNSETYLDADGVTFDHATGFSPGSQIVWWRGNQAFNSSLRIRITSSPGTMYLKNVMIRGYGGAPPCSNSGLPQPTAVPIVLEAGNLWTSLDDANNTLNGLGPGSVGSGVPNETGRQLFGYVKWLVSPSSADELAGPFAPLISHTGVFIALLFALILVYAIVWAVIWILRFIYWLYRLIVQIIDLVLQVAQVIGSAVGQVGQLIGGFIGSAIKFLF